ncbi:two pore calcium channel protein 1-like [Fagus crenata]
MPVGSIDISIGIKMLELSEFMNHGFIDKEQCMKLFEELNKYRTLPNISREEFELIFDELDDSHDFKINLDEFSDLCNAIALRFQKEPSPSCLENFPSVYDSLFSKRLKCFVRSPKFGYIISFFLILNLIAVIVETTATFCSIGEVHGNYRAMGGGRRLGLSYEDLGELGMQLTGIFNRPVGEEEFMISGDNATINFNMDTTTSKNLDLGTWLYTLDIENNSAQKVWQEIEFVFGWIYVLEMALKVYSFGFENYWRDGQNRFDFMVTWIIGKERQIRERLRMAPEKTDSRNLEGLDFSFNNLSGGIPSEVCDIPMLEYLILRSNMLGSVQE